MRLNLKYFGMLTEVTLCNSESISVPKKELTLQDAKLIIVNKYPKLAPLTFNIAINQQMVDKDTKLKEEDELAFLPPFAGG